MSNKLWGGRFAESTDAFVQKFTASVEFDQRMAHQDIACSRAHARMLGEVGVLSETDVADILQGLEQIAAEIESGAFVWSVELEDVHMNIEARLTALIGDAGKRLHTGRSRNDQVATDIRLFTRDGIDSLMLQVDRLIEGLLDLAERHTDVVMPGFTHLQTAQPVVFGHHVMAWQEMIWRDRQRLLECRQRLNISPLGAAALAGTSYPIDRHFTAEALGFSSVAENSLDAVSDRDFAIEFCAIAAIAMTHLSRIAEELVLWSSAQFDFIRLPDRFCTGSSIMPQKKNPDVPELVRGKTGRVNGHLISLLTLMKSQPLTYNKDNQEDKEPLFDALDTLYNSVCAFADMLPAMEVRADNMLAAAKKGFSTATDLADYLVRKGLAFRDCHEIVGRAVAEGVARDCDLSDFTLQQLQVYSDVIEEDVFEVLTPIGSVSSRNHYGGTAPTQVQAAILRARQRLADCQD